VVSDTTSAAVFILNGGAIVWFGGFGCVAARSENITHMLSLDGAYVERSEGSVRLRWVKAPTSAELTGLAQTLAQRIGRSLQRQGLPKRAFIRLILRGQRRY
jgi:hypothetical protein